LRIVDYRYDQKDLGQSGVFLTLIEGSARLVMGAIGEHNPALVRLQVGIATLSGAPNPATGNASDASVVVQGATTIVTVENGRVLLTQPNGQGTLLSSGQGLYVQPDGALQQGNIAQIAPQIAQTADGKQILAQLDSIQTYVFPQSNQRTVITLALPGSVEATTTSAQSPSPTTLDTTAQISAGTPATPAAGTPTAGTPGLPDAQPNLPDPPPLATSTLLTAATGGAGGGTPCGASCN